MLKRLIQNETITKYYDKEMDNYELIAFEAKLAKSKKFRESVNDICFSFYEISKSMRQVKNRLKSKGSEFIQNREKEILNSLVNVDSVRFESLDKHLRNGLLDILRHNS